jgi:hypothetical protein
VRGTSRWEPQRGQVITTLSFHAVPWRRRRGLKTRCDDVTRARCALSRQWRDFYWGDGDASGATGGYGSN